MKRIIVVSSIVLLLVPFTAFAQVDYCEGNFNYDQDVDGSDAFTFKSDFGRSGISNPCPADGPAPVPKTGQISCYDTTGTPRDCIGTGEDGDFQSGVAWPNPRFIDNANGTVQDNLTGLIWLKNAYCFGTRTWDNALADCAALASGSCGLTDGSSAGDWRLPNIKELQSLVDFNYSSPALPSGHPFTNAMVMNYWSATSRVDGTNRAWILYTYTGEVTHNSKANTYAVWPVRGGH